MEVQNSQGTGMNVKRVHVKTKLPARNNFYILQLMLKSQRRQLQRYVSKAFDTYTQTLAIQGKCIGLIANNRSKRERGVLSMGISS